MGLKITLDKNLEKIMSNYEKSIINNIKESIERETPKIENEVLDLVENKLTEFYEMSVMAFYNSYPNPIYERRERGKGSLYDLFQTKRNGKRLDYWFDETKFPSRTGYVGEDGLYTTVFKEGWHGGAIADDGVMRYRTPIPYYTYWGKEAVQPQFSPYETFIALKEDYEKRGFKKDYKNIWIKNLNKAGINVR